MHSFTPKPLHDQLVHNVLLLGSELGSEAPEPPLELVDAYSRAVLALCTYFESDLMPSKDKTAIRKQLKNGTTATA